jgi:putative ABC transport system ATP-binding protein
MALIEIRNLSKCYDLGEVQVHALKSVDVQIERGEFVALIGPSGSGKSTLMNTLGCLDRPTGGSYLLAGEEVVTMNAEQRAGLRNRQIGFVFQNFNLLSRTTALENTELPLMYSANVSRKQRHERAAEMLTAVGLGSRLDHKPNQLSGGQQQRVAIARALVNKPSILMADEPTGNLDTRTSQEIIQLFRKLNSEFGLTVIIVTHDTEVARQAKRILVLVDGEIAIDTTDSDAAEHVLRQRTRLPLPVAEEVEPTSP